MIGVIVFAALLEAGQIFVPGRDARARDFVIKAFGGIAGMVIAWIFGHIHQRIKIGLLNPTGLPVASAESARKVLNGLRPRRSPFASSI